MHLLDPRWLEALAYCCRCRMLRMLPLLRMLLLPLLPPLLLLLLLMMMIMPAAVLELLPSERTLHEMCWICAHRGDAQSTEMPGAPIPRKPVPRDTIYRTCAADNG
jgi:hypothetical protein